jgi:predicted  nucleic acid-binding Zn-ribbon protein
MATTNVSTEILRKLHRLHHQLSDLRERLERGPKQIRARQLNLAHHEEQLAKLQTESKAFRVATDAKQLQFKSKEAKVKELRVKLNTANSNREFQALKDQIAADEMTNSVLADEILEAMEKADAYQAQIAQSIGAMAKAKADADRLDKDVAQHGPLVRADLDRVEAELRECEAALPEEIRGAYERLVRQRGEDALAPIEEIAGEMSCGGCNQQVPLNLYNFMTLNRPIFCKSCGRMLYIPEGRELPQPSEE